MNTVYQRYFKRIFDILFGIILLICFSWIIVIIVIVYAVTLQFPIIFKQARIGKDEKSFIMYKFRTLSNENLPLEARRFPLGDFLRRTNMDELPQLLNVFIGDMSLVGPRPMPLEYSALFTQEQKRRHLVKPGITGCAQIEGKNSTSWQQKFYQDLKYIERITFWSDIRILLKTITLVISMKRDVSLMEEKFKG